MAFTPASVTPARVSARQALTGAIVFLAAFLAVSFVGGALADRSLPLPGAPAADVAAYYSANPAAAVAVTVLQALSVLGFAAFARAVVRISDAGPSRRRLLAGTAGFSVVAMLVSCALTLALAVSAASAPLTTVQALRLGGFYAGGVANVAALGLFVMAASATLGRAGFVGAPSRRLGYVAGALATLSVLSLAFYYASALLPIGRVLSMAWTVLVATVLLRRAKQFLAFDDESS